MFIDACTAHAYAPKMALYAQQSTTCLRPATVLTASGTASRGLSAGMHWKEGRGPERGCQERMGRRLEGCGNIVWSGYVWLQMPLRRQLGKEDSAPAPTPTPPLMHPCLRLQCCRHARNCAQHFNTRQIQTQEKCIVLGNAEDVQRS